MEGRALMLSKFGRKIINQNQDNLLNSFFIGLEVERQRTDTQGQISSYPYPQNIGNQQDNPWITNDFMETMTEVVTPVATTIDDALSYLEKLSNVLRSGLHSHEYLWPLSMPPELPQDRRQVEIAHANAEKRHYFFTWLKLHELQEATPCGMHINLGLTPQLTNGLTIAEKNQLYIMLAQGFLRYRFMLTYFFGASPLAERNYFLNNQGPQRLVRSIRQSAYGFGTKFTGNFSDIEHYQERILAGIRDGKLLAEHDFHSPVRLRKQGSIKDIAVKGTSYLELRMLDLNPWASVGINSDELKLICLMAAYFLVEKTAPYNLQQFTDMNEQVALESPYEHCQYQTEILTFLTELRKFAGTIQANQSIYDLLDRLAIMVCHPSLTINGQLARHVNNGSLISFAVWQAKKFQSRAALATNIYDGFASGYVPAADELAQYLSAK